MVGSGDTFDHRGDLVIRHTLLLATVLALTLPAVADAQVRRGRTEPPTPPWMPISVGVRGGWEQEQLASGGMLGAAVYIPVVRNGLFEVVPSFDALFLNIQTEYQYNVDVHFVPGRRRGGVYIGGGFALRESLVAAAGTGELIGVDDYWGFNLVLGGRNQVGPIQFVLGVRWSLLNDTAFDPNVLSLGLSYPLWGSTPRRPG